MKMATLIVQFAVTLMGFAGLFICQTANADGTKSDSEHSPRIIALAPHIVENLYEVGAGDLIIGRRIMPITQSKLIKLSGWEIMPNSILNKFWQWHLM